MVIKNLTKKVIVTTALASSLFVLPHFTPHQTAHAATPTISTTQQLLSYGSTGQSVKAVQERLKELGYYPYTIDGVYGSETQSGVIDFQKASHIGVDGVAGPMTLGKLFGSNPTAASSTSATRTTSSAATPTQTASAPIQWATPGHPSAVRTLQAQLQKLGYYHDTVDGIFGPNTQNAVMAFQRANNLSVDGVAGPNTCDTLFGSTAVAASSGSASHTSSAPSTSTVSSSTLVNTIIKDAKALQGVPYVYGGTTTSGFDCSGFTDYVFAENGMTLPRTAQEQYDQGSPTSLVPGALVFFHTVSPGISHVGIYIGNNEFISATSSDGVRIASMDNPYWKPRYVGAKTYIK